MKAGIITTTLLLLFIVALPACREKGKPDKDNLVPENILVNILADTYLGEALLDVHSVSQMYNYRDSISNYRDILSQYGYTIDQVDSTLKYYFIHDPKKLEKIYDRVTGKLLEMEANITSERRVNELSGRGNLWNGNNSYIFPENYRTDSIAFSIPLDTTGLYRFKASYILFPDDESIDPEVVIYFKSVNKEGRETRIYWDSYKLKKDGQSTQVVLEKILDITGQVTLEGCLFSHANNEIKWKKHARIIDIVVEKGTTESADR